MCIYKINVARHKKRWSQCMYMYYLLGHKLMELPISVDRKEILAENTYLLTLDGDIDFQPDAVTLLVDLMKKNKMLGKNNIAEFVTLGFYRPMFILLPHHPL